MAGGRAQRHTPPVDRNPRHVEPDSRAQRDIAGALALPRHVEPTVDAAVGHLAARQHGVVSRGQLRDAGLDRHAIARRLAAGWLLPVHRGVYAVGHGAIGRRGRAAAALLAAGDGAALSHRTAAELWLLTPEVEGPVHVTVAGRRARRRDGVAIHSVALRDRRDVTRRHGLAITTPARTLVDLARLATPGELERAVAEALVARLATVCDMHAAIERTPRAHAGAARLRMAIADGRSAPTRTELERALLRVTAAAGLPRPQANRRIGSFEVDFAWPSERVVVETDGWAAHGHRRAFEADRARDAELQALGYAVVRLTWRQITSEPLLVAARLARLLGARA